MDINSIRDQVSNLTLYDLKAGVRKVQNAVMNYTEMEAKVREATNNEPWGASSSLMQEIANGTNSSQLLYEIMPMIYKRFTDKTAEEWRQIYKALQLLEYLVKNGSERVIDDARQHVSLLRMLRQFHFIDQNGKDQGVNVRNRAQELAKLLSDVDSIRSERKKARANRSKYAGAEGGGLFSGGSRYGGFGSEEAGYGGYQGEVYGDGGGFGGNTSGFSDTQRRGDKFEEYDAEEDGVAPANLSAPRARAGSSGLRAASLNTIKRDAKIKKEPEQDLFDFGDEPVVSNGKGLVSSPQPTDDFGALQAGGGDDDFDDFQSATTPGTTTEAQQAALSGLSPPPAAISTISSSTSFAVPQPLAPAATNVNDLFSSLSPSATTFSPSATAFVPAQKSPAAFAPTGPNYFTSVQSTINTTGPSKPSYSTQGNFSSMSQNKAPSTAASLGRPTAPPAAAPKASGDAFGSLWSNASAKAGVQNKTTSASHGPDLASLAKKKNDEALWGVPSTPSTLPPRPSAPTPATAAQGSLGNGLDDLLG